MALAGLVPRRTLDIYPIGGMITAMPAKRLPLSASPDMQNMSVAAGRLRKRPGYRRLHVNSPSFGAPILGLASVQDEENGTHLFAMTATGVWKHDAAGTVWQQLTGPTLTGGPDRLFSWEVSQNSFVFSQGVDPVQRIPFTSLTYAPLAAACPPARYLTRGADRLILAFTVEGGASKPFRVRRSVVADHFDWTGVGSGFTDLTEFPYHIKGLKKIGSQIAVYSEKSVSLGTRTGDATAPIIYEPRVTGSGLYAPHTLHERGLRHMFFGNDSIYEFDGSNLEDIGFPVRDEIFRSINISLIDKMFGEVDYDTQEYMIFMITGASKTPDKIWVHHWGHKVWYPWTVDGPLCATLHRADNSTIWDLQLGTWDQLVVAWDQHVLQQAYPNFLTGHQDGQVYIWSPAELGDNGVPIKAYWTSKDICAEDVDPGFIGRQITLRTLTIWFKALGAPFSFNLTFSLDAGNTWSQKYPVTLDLPGSLDAPYQWSEQQFTGHSIRFRIEQTSATETMSISSFHPEIEIRDMYIP